MISGADGNVATQAEAVLIATRPAGTRAGAGTRAPRRPDRRRLPRRHRRARHRARRRLHQGLGASRLHRRAGDPVGRLREEGERRATDRGDGRGLRDRHRDRPRRASGSAPPRLPSDRRGRGVRRGDGGRQAARARRRSNCRTRSASRRRARPGCSPSSMAAPTSSGCTPATRRAKDCRRRCSPRRASKGRPA